MELAKLFVELSLDNKQFIRDIKATSKEAKAEGENFGKNFAGSISSGIRSKLKEIGDAYEKYLNEPLRRKIASIRGIARNMGTAVKTGIADRLRAIQASYENYIVNPLRRSREMLIAIARDAGGGIVAAITSKLSPITGAISAKLRPVAAVFNRYLVKPMTAVSGQIAAILNRIATNVVGRLSAAFTAVRGIASGGMMPIPAMFNRYLVQPMQRARDRMIAIARDAGSRIVSAITSRLSPIVAAIGAKLRPVAAVFNRYLVQPMLAVKTRIAAILADMATAVVRHFSFAFGAVKGIITASLAPIAAIIRRFIITPILAMRAKVVAIVSSAASAIVKGFSAAFTAVRRIITVALAPIAAMFRRFIITPLLAVRATVGRIAASIGTAISSRFAVALATLKGIFAAKIAPLIAIARTAGATIGRFLSNSIIAPLLTIGGKIGGVLSAALGRVGSALASGAALGLRIGRSIVVGVISGLVGIGRAVGSAVLSASAQAVTVARTAGMAIGRAVISGIKIALVAVAGVLIAGLAVGLKSINIAGELEQTTVAFETMLGSASAADKFMSELFEFTAKTPFQFDEVSKASKLLLAFGSDAENVTAELTRIGDISSGINAPIGEIAEIYGKARVQGRLFAEDINQLTGRGIPIIQELAKQFGVTDAEVRNLVKNGQVNFGHLEQAFISMTSEGGQFTDLMKKQSETLGGIWSTLKDNVTLALGAIGKALIENLDIKGRLKGAIDAVSNLRSFLVGLFGLLKNNVDPFQAFKTAYIGNFGMDAFERIQPFFDWLQDIKPRITAVIDAFKDGGIGSAISAFFEQFNIPVETQVLFAPLIDSIRTAMQWLSDNKDALIGAVLALGAAFGEMLATGAFVAIKAFFDALPVVLQWVLDNQDAIIAGLKAMAIAFGALVIIGVIVGLVNALLNPLVYIPIVIGLLAAAWESNFLGIRDALIAFWAEVQPILIEFGAWFSETIVPLLQELWIFWTTILWPEIKQALSEAWEFIKPILIELGAWFTETFVPAMIELYNNFVNVWWPAMAEAVATAWAKIKEIGDNIVVFFKVTIPTAVRRLKTAFDTNMKKIKESVNPVIEAVNSFLDAVNSVIDAINRIPAFDIPNIGNIPFNAEGDLNFSGGLSYINERGAELVRLPNGSAIYSNHDSQRIENSQTTNNGGASNRFEAGSVVVNVTADDAKKKGDFMEFLQASLRGAGA